MQQSYVEILWSSTLPRINFLLPWRVWPSRSSRLVKRHWAELFFDVQRSHLLLQFLYFCFFFHRLLCFFLNLRTPCVGPITIWDAPCLKEDQEHRGLEPWSMKWTMKCMKWILTWEILVIRFLMVFVSPRNCIFKSSWRAKIWMCLDSSGNDALSSAKETDGRLNWQLELWQLAWRSAQSKARWWSVWKLICILHFGCSCSILFGWDKCGITFTTFPHLSTHDGFSGKCRVIWGSFTGSFSYSWWSLGLKSYSLLHFNVWGYERRSSKEGMEVWNGNCSSNSLWS